LFFSPNLSLDIPVLEQVSDLLDILIVVFGGQSFAEGKRHLARPKEEHGYLSQRAGMELWGNIAKVEDKQGCSLEAL
jgi:hypothetical protein